MKEMSAVVGIIVAILLGLCGVIALSAIVNGYVLSVLWGWYMVPTLGLPPLSIPAAIGIALVVSYLTYQYIPEPENKEKSGWGRVVGLLIARPLFALFFGWIVQSFI